MEQETELKPTANAYTNEWYRQQFASIVHQMSKVWVEVAELAAEVKHLRASCLTAQRGRTEDMAAIGALQDDYTRLATLPDAVLAIEKRVDKASEVIAGIKRDIKGASPV